MFLPAENASAEVVNWTLSDSGSASCSVKVWIHHLSVSRAIEPGPSWWLPALSKNTPPRFHVNSCRAAARGRHTRDPMDRIVADTVLLGLAAPLEQFVVSL